MVGGVDNSLVDMLVVGGVAIVIVGWVRRILYGSS
jgi:hypothetical protein